MQKVNILLNKIEVKKLKKLIGIRNENLKIIEIYSEYLNNCPTLVSPELVSEIVEECSVSDETAFVSILSAACGFNTEENEDDRAFEERYFVPSVKKINPSEYEKNPYLCKIYLPNVKRNGWEFTSLGYKPYEGFICGDIILKEDLTEIPRLGFFDKEYTFPAVLQDGREWMAVKPNEIETMREPLELVNGKVLTLGLGLGYFTYMASEKGNVSEITVIEKDETVIELFKKYLLPQFINKDKVNILCADAFDYTKNELKDGRYDFVFADTWHDVSDGFPMYLRLKREEKRFKTTKFLYWIEKSLLSHLRWLLFDELAETVLLDRAQDGKGEPIRDFDGLKRFLSDESLSLIARNIRRIEE